MLVISRRTNESIIIDNEIEITVIEASKDKIKIGINAPKSVTIKRKEVLATEQSNLLAAQAAVNVSKDVLELMKNNNERCGGKCHQ